MSYYNNTISMYTSSAGDSETANFVELIISTLVSAVDEISRVEGENAILINNKLKLTFRALSTYTMISLTATVEENSWAMGNVLVVNGDGARTYKLGFHVAIGSDTISIKLRNFNTSEESVNFNTDILMFTTENEVNVFGYTNTTGSSAASTRNWATNTTLWRTSDKAQIFTLPKRLPYIYSSNSAEIDTIESKAVVNGTSLVDISTNMMDCSTITGDQIYPSGNKTYYAIDDHTLVEV